MKIARNYKMIIALLMTVLLSLGLAFASTRSADAATQPSLELTRVNTGKITLAKGKTYKIAPSATKGAKVTYKSSKKRVATVTSKGKIKARKVGKTTITVKAKKAGVTTKKKIRVKVVKKSKIKSVKAITAKAPATLYSGATCKMIVTFKPKSPSNKNVVFATSNASIATVSTAGVVTAKKPGTVTIRVISCASKKRVARATIKIYSRPSSVKISCAKTLVAGKKTTAKASVLPATAPQGLKWKSSNTAIAKVSSTGVVTGVSKGYATITATSTANSAKKASVQIAVAPKDTDGDGIPDEAEVKYLGTNPNKADASQAEDTIVYSDDCFEIDAANVVSLSAERNAERASAVISKLPKGAKAGSIIVIPGTDESPMGAAIKVEYFSQTAGGTLVRGTIPDRSEVYEFIYLNTEVDLSNAYIQMGDDWTLDDGTSAHLLSTSKTSFEMTNLGIEKTCALKIPADKGKGELGIKFKLDTAKIAISQYGPIPTQATFAVSGTATPYFKGKLEGKVAGTVCVAIPYASSGVTTWKGGVGQKKKEASAAASGLYVDLGVDLSLNGEFGLECGMPFVSGVSYTPGLGLSPAGSIQMGTNTPFDGLKASVAAKAAVHLNVGPELLTGGKSFIAGYISGGVDGKLSVKANINPAMDCVSFGAWLGLTANASLFGDNKKIKLSSSKEIFSSKNSPYKKVWHFDNGVYVGGDKDCTWKALNAGTVTTKDADNSDPVLDPTGNGTDPTAAVFDVEAGNTVTFGKLGGKSDWPYWWSGLYDCAPGTIFRRIQYNADGTVASDETFHNIMFGNAHGSGITGHENKPVEFQVLCGRLTFSEMSLGQCDKPTISTCQTAGYPLQLSKSEVKFSKTNLTYQLKASFDASKIGCTCANHTLTWSSSDSTVVTAYNGELRAEGTGTATVTVATSYGFKRTCKVTVG